MGKAEPGEAVIVPTIVYLPGPFFDASIATKLGVWGLLFCSVVKIATFRPISIKKNIGPGQ